MIRLWSPLWANPQGKYANPDPGYPTCSVTRPWQSYFTIHDSLNDSFEELNNMLGDRQEQYRLFNVDPLLLKGLVQLMQPFSMIFDQLEMANQPTLQNVVPSYYRMVKDTQINENDHNIIQELKDKIRYCLDEKYFSSILQIHWIGKYLDPSFKSFSSFQIVHIWKRKRKKFEKVFIFLRVISSSSCIVHIHHNMYLVLHHHRSV